MRFPALFFLAFLWFLFNLLRRSGMTRSAPQKPVPPPPQPSGVDPTQREGHQLETLLTDLRRGLEETARAKARETQSKPRPTLGSKTAPPKPQTIPPQVALETVDSEIEVQRPERTLVDRDEVAEQVAASRIAAVEARSGALTDTDHLQFEQRVRQEPADHTAVRSYTTQQLRDAVVWREILGPPVALRGDEPEVQ